MNDFVKALTLRGFFILEEVDCCTLGKGSHSDDEKDIKQMLEKLEIPATFDNKKIKILSKNLGSEKLKEIMWYPARNHEAGGNGGFRSWKYFIKRLYGPKIPTITLETGVALFVKSLSVAGITTVSSCDGHGKRSPYISFFGHFNACWFMVLYKNLFQDYNLNYDWIIKDYSFSDPHLNAKSKNDKWDLDLVLEDTNRMASFLIQNGEKISSLKRELFGKNRNSTNKLLKEMSFDELYEWMEQRYLANSITIGGV